MPQYRFTRSPKLFVWKLENLFVVLDRDVKLEFPGHIVLLISHQVGKHVTVDWDVKNSIPMVLAIGAVLDVPSIQDGLSTDFGPLATVKVIGCRIGANHERSLVVCSVDV